MEDASGISRAEYAYGKLRNAIRSNVLKPGQRLIEAELANRFEISRTPIREAISRLTMEGLIQLTARGASVARLSNQQVREVYFLREILEGAASQLAASTITDAEIMTMREFVAPFGTDISAKEAARLNELFHQAILDAAHNEYLTQALARLSDTLHLLPGTTFQKEGRIREVMTEHLDILKALEARDGVAAEQAARLHIRKAGLVRLRMMFETSAAATG
ncbi:MAG: GntR family transcriptional regulator [Mesorhizobium sp.]|nr:MAG: GntR family transcriptional regulator [Mesorhizobium sp.]